MGCTIQYKIETKLNNDGILKGQEIKSLLKFEAINSLYTKHAEKFYGLDGYGKQLYSTEERNSKIYAIPNKSLLRLLDNVIEEQEELVIENIDETTDKDIESLEDKSTLDFLSLVEDETKEAEEINKDVAEELFGTSDNISAKGVLTHLQNNYHNLTQGTQEVLDKLTIVLEKNKVGVKFISVDKLKNPTTFMQYNATANIIEISRKKMEGKNIEFVVQSFLHEVVHSGTAKAFLKPSTLEEQMFRNYIQEMYNKYLNLSGITNTKSRNTYGFTNPIEFIAEIMTNPLFQNEIKALDTNMWNKLIDFIRTLFGLKKTSEYYNIIDAITNISQQSDYSGGISVNDVIFESKEFGEDIPEDYDLSTTSKALTHNLNRIKDNIEENLRIYDRIVRTSKEATKIKTYSKKLESLLKNIEKLDETNQWRGISMFVDQLQSNINALEKKFDKVDFKGKDIKKTINSYEKYLNSHSLIGDLQDFIADARRNQREGTEEIPIPESELKAIEDKLTTSSGVYAKLDKSFKAYMKEETSNLLNNPKYALEVMAKWRNKLGAEWKELEILENKTSWVARQMNTVYADEIQADIKSYINKLMKSPAYDISTITRLFNSALNTNSKFVQIFQAMLNEIKDKIITITREKDFELKNLFDRFIAEKGSKKPSVLYGNMIETDKNGNIYLKGEYKLAFREQYETELAKYQIEKEEIAEKYGLDSHQYRRVYNSSKFKQWVSDNTEIIDVSETEFPVINKLVPKDKWKSDISMLSEIELEVLNEFRNITTDTNKKTFGISSLVSKPIFGAKYYKLPSMTKSDLEHATEGTLISAIGDKWRDLTVRADDIGYEEVNSDISGNPIHHIKVHYRGNIPQKQQSIDLFTIYRLEHRNGVNFSTKHAAESDLTTLVEIAKNKSYYKTTGIRIPVLGRFINRNKKLVTSSKDVKSNTYLKMQSMLESNLYDILHKNAGKLGQIDTNKGVGFLNGWTAKVGMSLNEVTAATNVLNGKAQLFLETIAGNFISGKSLAKAERFYFAQMPELMKDLTNPVKASFINQLNEMFDTDGLISVSVKQAFIKNTMAKTHANSNTLQFMQDGGEHWMQSTLAIGVLDGIKVMNENNDFIDKDGGIVANEKNAASLFDMLELKNGILTVSDKVNYTTYSQNIKYNEGGKELVNNLIKKKLFDSYGNYDSNMQPEVMRHWYGKFGMMYRKFLIPMGIARYRGFSSFDTKAGDLGEHQRFFSDALQDYEEGFYTSFARFMWTGVIPAVKQMELQLATSNWDAMSDMEKRNVHKAIAEMGITMVVLPLLQMALLAMTGGDDDKKWAYFLLLQVARLESELSSFRNINEQYRILNNPIPAVNVLKSMTQLIGRFAAPWSWGEKYEAGERKGQFKIRRNIEKMTPILNSTNISYQEKYNFITNIKLY